MPGLDVLDASAIDRHVIIRATRTGAPDMQVTAVFEGPLTSLDRAGEVFVGSMPVPGTMHIRRHGWTHDVMFPRPALLGALVRLETGFYAMRVAYGAAHGNLWTVFGDSGEVRGHATTGEVRATLTHVLHPGHDLPAAGLDDL